MPDLSDTLKSLTRLGYSPENIDLNEFLTVLDDVDPATGEPLSAEETGRMFEGRARRLNTKDDSELIDYFSGPPLTPEEAAQVDQRINQTVDRLKATEGRLREAISRIDAEARGELSNDDLEFSVTFRGARPRLLRIIKKVFGEKTRTVTYAMYKEALEARRIIEEQQLEEYTAPEPPELDEEEG